MAQAAIGNIRFNLLAAGVLVLIACGSGDRSPQSVDQEAGSSSAQGKVEPDLVTTIRFIGNVSSLDGSPYYHRDEVAFEAANPCTAVFSNPRSSWAIDFSKLNPESVRIGDEAVQVRTTNAEWSIVRTGGYDQVTDTLKFYVNSADDVSRVQEALVYVIGKCGGKGDPF